MYILVSGATATVRALLREHTNLGVLVTPSDGNAIPERKTVWAADNSVLTKQGFDDARFRRFLGRLSGRDDCRFVAVPDHVERVRCDRSDCRTCRRYGGHPVGDAGKTLKLWQAWHPIVREHGLTPALVLQDGMAIADVPWFEVGGVFVGGSDRYKLSESAAAIVAEANRRNLWTHMGRVNSARRILHAASISCCSIDGTGFSSWPERNLPWALKVSRQVPIGFCL